MKEYIIEKAKELIAAHSCCAEAKEAAQNWLDAIGTPDEAQAAKKLIAELEEDVEPIDDLIAFGKSDRCAQIFGAEGAAGLLAHAQELKAAGAKYCDCPACAAAAAILEKKDALL